jgi:hypothetical protein
MSERDRCKSSQENPYIMEKNRVTESLLKHDQQKILVDLRKYAFERDPQKIINSLAKRQTGLVK